MGHYVPLSWMTLRLDCELWGMQPMGYHLTSLLLHTVNAVLVYHLARGLLKRAAAGLQSNTFGRRSSSIRITRKRVRIWRGRST